MVHQLQSLLVNLLNCSLKETSDYTTYFTFKHIKKNEILLRNGDVCNYFYFILHGGLRVYFLNNKGDEKTNHIALNKTIITALSSFITQKPSFENIDALVDSNVYYLTQADFYLLVSNHKIWEKFYTRILETAYITKIKRIEFRTTLSAKERFETVIAENPLFLQQVSNKVLASYIDVSQETLSRLKSKK